MPKLGSSQWGATMYFREKSSQALSIHTKSPDQISTAKRKRLTCSRKLLMLASSPCARKPWLWRINWERNSKKKTRRRFIGTSRAMWDVFVARKSATITMLASTRSAASFAYRRIMALISALRKQSATVATSGGTWWTTVLRTWAATAPAVSGNTRGNAASWPKE